MLLTDEQLRRLDKAGYLFFPSMFTPEEAALLKAEANHVYALERDEVWRETSEEGITCWR